jgi:general secretion pathway protein K
MRLELTKTNRKGFVVVVVLCTVVMMGVLLLGFNRKTYADLCAVDDFRKSQQALNCARAGLNIAIAAVRNTGNIHTNKTLLNLFSGESPFDVGDGKCFVTVVEENGKLNINLLKDHSGNLDRSRIEQLLRLVDVINQEHAERSSIGYDLVPSIIDWTDTDEEVTYLPLIKNENLGAESAYYGRLESPYRCKNAPLDTTDGLLLVKGVTPQVYDCIRDYITVYGEGKININCAPKHVIESLSEKMDSALAQLIIDRRKIKPFESIMELQDVPGMTDDVYYTIKKTVTVSPTERYYNVMSRGNVDRLDREIVAILKRNVKAENVSVIFYKEL